MPSLLRRRLTCFYCGTKSGANKTGSLREWRCLQCDATNHLDENGDITDPPLPETPVPQYGSDSIHTFSPSPPPLIAGNDSVFCSQCIKNQNFIMQSLANYYPDDADDQTLEQYEAVLPKHKADLEARYPPVCAKCAPLVNQKLQNNSYQTHAAYLKANLNRKKSGWSSQKGSLKTDTLIFAGALMWFISVLGQLSWHILGLIKEHQSLADYIPIDYVKQQAVNPKNYDRTTTEIPAALVVGLGSLWWNPQLRIASRKVGRLLNMKDYYRLQLCFLALRAMGYWVIAFKSPHTPIPLDALHGSLIIFILACTFSSFQTVEFRKKPVLTDFPLKLVEVPEITQTEQAAQLIPNPRANVRPSFPIGSLASASASTSRAESVVDSRRSSSTSTNWDRDDVSEMDWTPTGPLQSLTTPRNTNSFLPPSTTTPQITPFRATLASTNSAFKSFVPPTPGRAQPGSAKKDVLEMFMAPPKLNLAKDDTGLETLFNNVFTLDDEPGQIKNTKGKQQQQQRQQSQPQHSDRIVRSKSSSVWAACLFWVFAILLTCTVVTAAWLIWTL